MTVETVGDIDLKLAVPITNSNIGESLRIVSSGNISQRRHLQVGNLSQWQARDALWPGRTVYKAPDEGHMSIWSRRVTQ